MGKNKEHLGIQGIAAALAAVLLTAALFLPLFSMHTLTAVSAADNGMGIILSKSVCTLKTGSKMKLTAMYAAIEDGAESNISARIYQGQKGRYRTDNCCLKGDG